MTYITVPAIFDGKNIRLLEEPPVNKPYRVMVTFLSPNEIDTAEAKMERFKASFGAWDDDRSIKETINDIYESRQSRPKPPSI